MTPTRSMALGVYQVSGREGLYSSFNNQGWDSSAFTQISVEQKLKCVVDDDHIKNKKIDGKKIKIKSEAIRVRIWLVRILSCSQVIPGCARTLHCC